MHLHPEVLPDVFAVFKYLQEQGRTGIPYQTLPQFEAMTLITIGWQRRICLMFPL